MTQPAVGAVRATLWTGGLFLALLGADRALLGPNRPVGWQQASTVADVPAAAGAPLEPSYLPATLGWPPQKIAWQVQPQPGWWLELASAAGDQAWIGAGAAPPDHPALGCLDDRGCPKGWHALSRQFGQETVVLVTTLPARAAHRMLEGLRVLQR